MNNRLDQLLRYRQQSPPFSQPLPSISTSPVPIHKRSFAVNPQAASPLYNGRIPPEIRNQIFVYALTEYTKTEPSAQYFEATNYTRPGFTAMRAIATPLLLICRRTYLETYHLPPILKEHRFWHDGRPLGHAGNCPEPYAQHEQDYLESMATWQMELVKELHLFTQSFWLEEVFPRMCNRDFMQGIEKLKITIRRSDWWEHETNTPLGINPMSGDGDWTEMLRDWQDEEAGEIIPWNTRGWGYDKYSELLAIVKKAKTWKFPAFSVDNGYGFGGVPLVFTAEGFEPKWTTWQGSEFHWSNNCPYCNCETDCEVKDPPDERCVERMRLWGLNYGPLLYVATLKWKLGRADGGVRT